MKISYFLKRLAAVALLGSFCSSQALAYYDKPDAGMVVVKGDDSGADISEKIEINLENESNYTYGLWVKEDATVGEVSSTINVLNVNEAYVVGIYKDTSSTVDLFSGSITITSNLEDSAGYLIGGGCNFYGIGLKDSKTGDSSTFTVDWAEADFSVTLYTAQNPPLSTGTAWGIYLNEAGASIATGEGEYIGGTIEAKSDYLHQGNAVGIELTQNTQVGDVRGTIKASTEVGTAVGIKIDDASIGTISGKVIANGNKGDSTAIIYNTDQELVLSGATIKATKKIGGETSWTTAIENTTKGIRLLNEGAASTIQGDLNACGHDLNFNAGDFELSGNTWTAGSVSVGSDGGTAHLSLESVITVEAETLNFYINDVTDFSDISIADGYTLNLESIKTINVYLEDGVMESGDFDLTLMDGSIAILDDVQVNYVLGEQYSDEFLSHGSADDGTSFIVSSGAGGGGVIPEPCTVSLSFIALAGLLARRRRRH